MTRDAKGGLASLMGGDTQSAADEEESGADMDTAKADAGRKVMKAMKAGDETAFTTALQDFVQLCMEE